MERAHRRGAEFSRYTRYLVFKEAQGMCQWPTGCTNPHNNTVDHITPLKLGTMLGMDKGTLKSRDNAQALCEDHDLAKKEAERYFMEQRQNQLEKEIAP